MFSINVKDINVFVFSFYKLKETKKTNWKRSVFGGLIFGTGWAISGACTAPIYVLVGFKWQIGVPLLVGAIVGTYLYSLVASKIEK